MFSGTLPDYILSTDSDTETMRVSKEDQRGQHGYPINSKHRQLSVNKIIACIMKS